ncbi:MAG: MBL fold metallo-hydrolase [Verrucomicrobia bacterium]|nr:MBL fold metallo-hydrolase [Verrucomicrobiota bacterium]MBS0636944.1 MBL fold metallo-hydrolase [Verrucomicrobiota bacterium]
MEGFCPLASGSKGNCIYVGTKNTKILIDAGISTKSIQTRLNEMNVDISEIQAILISHEHSDHIAGLKVLALRHNIPIFANQLTAKAICDYLKATPKFKIFLTGEPFEFGDLEIHPFSVQHDAADPVAFTIRFGDIKIGVCTDLGFVTTLVAKQLEQCNLLYIEANHKPEMVHASSRPMIYKQRVLGRSGHLSNESCAELLSQIAHSDLKQIYLAHLSSECNCPNVALDTITGALRAQGIEIPVSIALQEKRSRATLFN